MRLVPNKSMKSWLGERSVVNKKSTQRFLTVWSWHVLKPTLPNLNENNNYYLLLLRYLVNGWVFWSSPKLSFRQYCNLPLCCMSLEYNLCRSLIEAITCSQSLFGWINSKTYFPHSFQMHGKCLYYLHAYWNDILFKNLFTESVRQQWEVLRLKQLGAQRLFRQVLVQMMLCQRK